MKYFLMMILVVFISSCVRNKSRQVIQNTDNTKMFTVREVIQTSSYTYLKVKDNFSERWVAVLRQEASPGEVYFYDKALQMNNFYSNELDRTFEVIYFVSQISKSPLGQEEQGTMPAHSGSVGVEQKGNISIKKAEGEITIAQLFSGKDGFAGKEMEIRGVVVKVNEGIMDRNWIHIQDGTSFSGNYDLTITSQDIPELNDEVTFKGLIATDKNFGSGYFYDVIMENAVLVSRKPASSTL